MAHVLTAFPCLFTRADFDEMRLDELKEWVEHANGALEQRAMLAGFQV